MSEQTLTTERPATLPAAGGPAGRRPAATVPVGPDAASAGPTMPPDPPRGQRASQRASERARESGTSGTTMVGAAKQLALWLGVAVLVVLLGSCGLGFAISRGGESAVLNGLRDVGVMLLLIFYVVQAIIWAAIYFALAWVIGYFGPRLPAGLKWVGVKMETVDGATTKGAERFVIRPLAGGVGQITAARTFLSRSVSGVSDGATAVQRWSRELTDWPTLQHRLRGVAAHQTPAGMSMPVDTHVDGVKAGSIVESGRVGAERR